MPIRGQLNFFKKLFKKKSYSAKKIDNRIDKSISQRQKAKADSIKREKYFSEQELAHSSYDPSWSRELGEEAKNERVKTQNHSKRIKKLKELKEKNLRRLSQKKVNYSSAANKQKIRGVIRNSRFASAISEAEVKLRSIGIRDSRANEYSGLELRISRDRNNKLSGSFYQRQVSYYEFLLEKMQQNFPKSRITENIKLEMTNLINSL